MTSMLISAFEGDLETNKKLVFEIELKTFNKNKVKSLIEEKKPDFIVDFFYVSYQKRSETNINKKYGKYSVVSYYFKKIKFDTLEVLKDKKNTRWF